MTTIGPYHVIKDPVHGTLQFTDMEDAWVKPFINSPHFQRLRHIKQLGLGDLIFPGAVHTRFNHCLGCAYVGSQIAHKIGLPDEQRQLVMIACLLHDIGHGPFSHAFEDIFYERSLRHEDWTPCFLADFRTPEFFAAYNQRNPKFPLNAEKFTQIEQMIRHQAAQPSVLADIVSSQMDADRLDYLLRDSHFCGVTYGLFDFRWLLHCMAIVKTPKGERLGITHKGIGVVEHYLMARRLMMRNIYHLQKKLGIEFLIIQLLAEVAKHLEEPSFAETKKTRLGTFLSRVNTYNQAAAQTQTLEKLKTEFLRSSYPIYKDLCDYDVFALIKFLAQLEDGSTVCAIATRLQNRVMPKIVRLDFLNVQEVEQALQRFKKQHPQIEAWQLALVKTPQQAYFLNEDPIWVENEAGQVQPLHEMSQMIHAMSDQLEQTAFLCVDRALDDHSALKNFLKTELADLRAKTVV